MPEPNDQPDIIANLDQAQATLKALAPVLGQYFVSLCAQGFERAEAMELVGDLQQHWLRGDQGDPD